MPYHTYILTNKRNGTFYTGVTSNLSRRIFEHKNELISGFTKEHQLKMLVYYETHEDVLVALAREKLIKKWRRKIKLKAIEEMNPNWRDLYFEL